MQADLYVETNMNFNSHSGMVGYILVLTKDNGQTEELRRKKSYENTTTTRAMIQAINMALGLLRPCKVRLWIDNSTIINAMTKGWIEEWEQNGWKNKRGKPVGEEWASLVVNMRLFDIEVYAKMHNPYKVQIQSALKA